MTTDHVLVLLAVVGTVQSIVMAIGGFYAWSSGRDAQSRTREFDELRERLVRVEARLWELR